MMDRFKFQRLLLVPAAQGQASKQIRGAKHALSHKILLRLDSFPVFPQLPPFLNTAKAF
jgi:hypothetical protein